MEGKVLGSGDLMPTGKLGGEGKKLWEKIYNESVANGDSKEVAAQKAWSGVKTAGWKKDQDGWSKKSDALAEFSMHITKASLSNGVMRWAATNSDIEPDLYGEKMSLELYEDFISHIENEDEVPAEFKSAVCSDYWCGGTPYLSVSHYSDLNGDAVPGEPLELFVDGKKFKAKGILFDTPIGHSVWRSLKEDKNRNTDDKIRISIGFLDLAHKHGEDGTVWVRDGAYSYCPECLHGVKDKIYVKGYLVHLALTRVPVNTRTEMVLEEKSMAKKIPTRKEDAESIVGKTIAEEIDAKQRVSVQKSDVLVEMSETVEETAELIAGAEAEKVEEKPADESPIGDPVAEMEKPEAENEVSEPIAEKSEDGEMDKVVEEAPKYVENLPLGGATSMKDAEQYVAMKKETIFVMDAWSILSDVIWNIFSRDDIANKKEATAIAVSEFSNMLAAKAMVAFSVAEEPHELKPAIDDLLNGVDNSLQMKADTTEKLASLNPALQKLGESITTYVMSKSQVEEKPVPAENKDDNTLLGELKSLIQPMSEAIATLASDVGILKSQNAARGVEVKSRIPQPRTFQSSVIKSQVEEAPKPGSLKAIARKSVGL